MILEIRELYIIKGEEMLGDENTIAVLSKMMEMSTSRQKIIAHNIANANTPGYTRRELDFKNELKERLTKRIRGIKPAASEDFVDLSLRSESSRFALFREIMSMDEKDLSEQEAK